MHGLGWIKDTEQLEAVVEFWLCMMQMAYEANGYTMRMFAE